MWVFLACPSVHTTHNLSYIILVLKSAAINLSQIFTRTHSSFSRDELTMRTYFNISWPYLVLDYFFERSKVWCMRRGHSGEKSLQSSVELGSGEADFSITNMAIRSWLSNFKSKIILWIIWKCCLHIMYYSILVCEHYKLKNINVANCQTLGN